MELTTMYSGLINYEEDNVIKFVEGLPGFEENRQFLIVLSNDDALPFHYLQSIEDTNLAFLITNPFLFVNPYDFEIPDDVVNQLKIKKPSDISIYSMTTIPDDLENTSINLTAPIIVNNANNLARQVILNEYPVFKYFIFQPEGKDE